MEKPFIEKRIGVLMGGKSGEREVSLRSGAGVLASLQKQGYSAVAIDVDKNIAAKIREEKVDVAFIALHGFGGEDGKIQGLLEIMEIPYTGSGVQSSANSMDKAASKLIFSHHGIPFPKTYYLDGEKSIEQQCEEMGAALSYPIMAKPSSEGSSLGCYLMKSPADAPAALAALLKDYPFSIAEEYIEGIGVTIGVIGTGGNVRALPVLELEPTNEFYDYEAKYTKGMTIFHCPARLNEATTKRCMQIAVDTHRALSCDGVSRVDIMVDKNENCFVLELNSIPGMTELSDLPAEIHAEGGTYDQLVLEILASAGLGKV